MNCDHDILTNTLKLTFMTGKLLKIECHIIKSKGSIPAKRRNEKRDHEICPK